MTELGSHHGLVTPWHSDRFSRANDFTVAFQTLYIGWEGNIVNQRPEGIRGR